MMLNLLKKAEKDMCELSNVEDRVEEIVTPRNRAFRLVTGSLLLLNGMGGGNNKQPNLMCGISKIIGGAFILYGLTGWDPLKLSRKTVKVNH